MPPAADAPAPKLEDAAVVVAAPVVAAVVAEPVIPAAGADHVVPPVDQPKAAEPVVEGGDKAPAVKLASDEPSLLEEIGKDGKPLDAKVADPKAAELKPAELKDGEKPAEPKPEDKPVVVAVQAEPIAYTAFELPADIKLDDAKLGAATTILGKYQVPQEAAQELVAMHVENMQAYHAHLTSEQHRVFGETRREWRKQILADGELGGAGHQTAMAGVARMRDLFVPEGDRQAFNDFLRITGAGDHPQFHKLLHRIAQRFDEPTPSPLPRNPSPDANRSKGGRRSALYDHPTSRRGANAS